MLYHYTRLLPEEIEYIKINGVLPLSEELIQLKERVLRHRGIEVTLNRSALDPAHGRVNRFCFVNKSHLTRDDFDMVYDLCKLWGGEAVSDWFKDENWYADILEKSIPVEISIHIPDVMLYHAWGGIMTNLDSEGEGFVDSKISAKYIAAITPINLISGYIE